MTLFLFVNLFVIHAHFFTNISELDTLFLLTPEIYEK
ncbi:hypothetical protein EAYG_02798 [Escherichia coli TA014]|nr:hypothetical protein EAYG_02798 [Escherichia coli TA014]